MQSGCIRAGFGPILPDLLFALVSLSLLGLVTGALLVPLGRPRSAAGNALDGLALGMWPALVLARLLPHAFESLGALSLVLAAAGFGIARHVHHRERGHETAAAGREARLTSALVMPALWLHALADGATLAMSSSGRVGESGMLLATATILHRVPEGLFVALQQPRRPTRTHWQVPLVIWLLASATLLGALLGQRVFDVLPDTAFDAVLALGAGAMLRMLSGHSHAEDHAPASRATHALAGAAFLAGLAAVLAVPSPHDVLVRAQPHELSMAQATLPLFIESAPAVLLGLGISGALQIYGSQSAALRVSARSTLGGLGLAMLQPTSPTSTFALGERLLAADVSRRVMVACCAGASVLAWDAALLALALLGPTVALARWLGGCVLVLVAAHLTAGSGASRAERPHWIEASTLGPRPASWLDALRASLEYQTPWLALGLLLAAALEAGLAPQWLVPAPWDVPLAALLALPVYFGALGLTPIALVLLHKGASLGAVLTLGWISPVCSWPVLGWLRQRLGARAAYSFGAGCVTIAMALGFAANSLLSTASVPAVHPLLSHPHGFAELACACVLAGLAVFSLLRCGPRGLYAAMWAEHHARPPSATVPRQSSPRRGKTAEHAELGRDGVG